MTASTNKVLLSDWLARIAPYVTAAQMATIPATLDALYQAERSTEALTWAEVLLYRLAYGQRLDEALAALWAQASGGRES